MVLVKDCSVITVLFWIYVSTSTTVAVIPTATPTSYESLFPAYCKTPVGVTYQCPTGWLLDCGECYRFYTEKLSWQDANKACENQGGFLSTVSELSNKINIAKLVLVNTNAPQYWIGYKASDECSSIVNDYYKSYPVQNMFCNSALPFLCQTTACHTNEFKCSNNKCINGTYKCDGEDDCGDNSDEQDCANQCRYRYSLGTSTTQTLNSPNIGSYYGNNRVCSYVLEGPVGSRIQLAFTYLVTEKFYDTIDIYVGGSTLSTSQYVLTYSGSLVTTSSNSLKPVISTNNYMIVRFTSDAGGPQSDTLRFAATWSKTNTFTNSEVQLNATSIPAALTSPNYPSGYPSNTKASWKITAVGNFDLVTIMMKNVYLASGDKVTIYDGTTVTDPVLAVLTGPLVMEDSSAFITTSDRNAFVVMDTSSLLGDKGFSFNYMSGCDITIEAKSGEIQSPGYQYLSDSDTAAISYPILATCHYSLKLPAAMATQSITLKFEYISIQDSVDELTVYKGDRTSSIAYLKLSAAAAASGTPAIDNTGQLYLKFITDAIHTDTTKRWGFRAKYSIGCEDPQFNNNTVKPLSYGTIYTAKFQVSCQQGYYFAQEEFGQCGVTPINAGKQVELECSYGGRWNVDRLPQCEAVYCVNIPDVQNGFIKNFTSSQFGGRVTYECFEGFGLVGTNYVMCQNDGSWSAKPSCQAAICDAVTSVSDGSLNVTVVTGSGRDYGSVVSFQCMPGYHLTSGGPVITCLSNGTWSGPHQVQCTKLQCKLPAVGNGSVGTGAGALIEYQVSVDLVCNTGYVIYNTTATDKYTATCLANRTIGLLPSCVDKDECIQTTSPCTSPAICQNTVGSYTCSCPTGYRLDASKTSCTDINECEEGTSGCYSKNYCQNTVPGYSCSCPTSDQGLVLYTAAGMNGIAVRGGETGLDPWNVYRINHTCIPNVCPHPTGNQAFGNGTMMTYKKTMFYRGDTVTFLCKLGYGIGGVEVDKNPETKTITCKNNGEWDSPTPTCTPIMCNELQSQSDFPSSFRIEPTYSPYGKADKVPYGATLTMKCEVPGRNPGNFTRTRKCMYDQAQKRYLIVGDPIECGEINCGTPSGLSGVDQTMIPTQLDSTKYNSVFTFKCIDGFTLIGNSSQGTNVVRCMENGRWGLGSLRCAGDSCTDPGRPADGDQQAVSYEAGQSVTFTCKRAGYEPNYKNLTCQRIGTGSTAVMKFVATDGTPSPKLSCSDTSAPVFSNCPNTTLYVKRYNTLSYTPLYNDNSNLTKEIKVERQNPLTSVWDSFDLRQPLSDPEYIIRITVTDFSGNVATCQFTVKIQNENLPTFAKCPDSVTIYQTLDTESRVIDVKSTYGVNATTYSSELATSTFTPAVVAVNKDLLYKPQPLKQTASDEFGNQASCYWSAVVLPSECAQWDFLTKKPLHGSIVFNNQTRATVSCSTSYTFYSVGSVKLVYDCIPGQGFINDRYNDYVPQCVEIKESSYQQKVSLRYSAPGFDFTDSTKRPFYITYLKSVIPSGANYLNSKSLCGTYTTVSILFDENTDAPFNAVTLDVILTIKYVNTVSTRLQSCIDSVKNIFIQITNLDDFSLQNLSPSNQVKLVALYQSFTVDTYACPAGQSLQRYVDPIDFRESQICIPCPPGYYFNSVNCTRCPIGQYQNFAGMTKCEACPTGTSTYNTGAASVSLCKDQCPPPFISNNGLAPCKPCPEKFYRSDIKNCTACPADTVTRGPLGGGSLNECYGKCPAGSFSYDGYGPNCRPCPLGYYSTIAGSTTCTACSFNARTLSTGSNDTAACVDSNKVCSNQCINGTCSVENQQIKCMCTAGYTGTYCETKIQPCDSQPCFYGGVCTNKVNGYECLCPAIPKIEIFEKKNQIPSGQQTTFKPGSNAAACRQECITRTTCKVSAFLPSTSNCLLYDNLNDPVPYITLNNTTSYEKYINMSQRYGGVNCEEEPNDCPTDPASTGYCQNGGKCQDLDQTYKCLCRKTDVYSGASCTDRVPICTSVTCQNGGVCSAISDIRYMCNCPAGYTGDLCETNINDCATSPCLNGGSCIDKVNDYECKCPTGFTGKNCETRPANLCSASPCGTVGMCVEDYRTNEQQCVCEKGYVSDTYYTNWVNAGNPVTSALGDIETISEHIRLLGANPCGIDELASAECQTVVGRTPFNLALQTIILPCNTQGLICYHANQTAGTKCLDYEVRYKCLVKVKACRQYSECTTQQCQNGASCEPRVADYQCRCQAGWDGYNCQHDIDECASVPCKNAGVCYNGANAYNCTCQPGYQGANCEINPNNCLSNPCDPVGTDKCEDRVNDFNCLCKPGYTGKNCSENIQECSSNPCLHNGKCVDKINDYECQCPRGWEGKSCETITKYCTSSPCKNGAMCYEVFNDFYCGCKAGYTGKTCSIGQGICKVAAPCLNGGVCDDSTGEAKCNCPAGYVGAGCQCQKDYCSASASICQNGATCSVSKLGTYTCQCPVGFTGVNCQTNIDDCVGVNCGTGKCVDGVGVAFCECPAGKSGNNCEKDINRNYDLQFTAEGEISNLKPFSLNTSEFSLGLWVRYTDVSSTTAGTPFVKLYSTSSQTSTQTSGHLVSLDDQQFTVSFDGTMASGNSVTVKQPRAYNDGQWHFIVLTMSGSEIKMYVDSVSNTGSITVQKLPAYGLLTLGSASFRGSLSAIQVWRRSLSASDIASIYSDTVNSQLDMTKFMTNLTLDYDWSTYSSAAGVKRVTPSVRGKQMCQRGEVASGFTCVVKLDKFPPTVDSTKCPPPTILSSLPATGERAVSFTGQWNPNTFFSDGQISASNLPSDVYSTGVHKVTYSATDLNGNRAQCSFNVFVPLFNCDKTLPTGVCSASTGCPLTCTAGKSTLGSYPTSLKCDSSGVYNIWEPYIPYRLPQCGVIDSAGKKRKLAFSWTYNLGSVTITPSLQTSIETALRNKLIAWSDKFSPKVCVVTTDCTDFTIKSTINAVGQLSVEIITSQGVSILVQFIPVEDQLLKAVIQDNFFFLPNIGANGASVTFDTVSIVSQTYCNNPYQAVQELDICVGCPVGTYFNSTTLLCTQCPLGYYQPSEGQTSCIQCSDAKTTITPGAVSSAECYDVCKPGYQYKDGSCTPCGNGFYQPDSGKTYCLACAVGKTTNEINATSDTQCFDTCQDGYYLTASGSCLPCPVGTYRKRGQTLQCIACQAGYVTPSTGSTDASQCTIRVCAAGQYVSGIDCLACPQNTYRTLATTNCTQCPSNTRTDGTGAQTLEECKFYCTAGQFVSNATGTNTCVPCARDYYKVATDYYSRSCLKCPDIKPRTAGTGSTSVDDCKYGNCRQGQVADPTDVSKCINCPYDTYQSNPDPVYLLHNCTACPANSGTVIEGAPNATFCKQYCPSGEQLESTKCVKCPRGYYKENTTPSSRYLTCVICPANLITPAEGANSSTLCNQGNCTAGSYISGTSCVTCPIGFYNPDKWQTSCTKCPPESTTRVTGATSVSQCDFYPNRTVLVVSVRLTLTWYVDYSNPDSARSVNLRALLQKNMLKLFSEKATLFRGTSVTIGRFTPGSVMTTTSGLFAIDPNAQPELQNVVNTQIATGSLGDPDLPTDRTDQAVVLANPSSCAMGQYYNSTSGQCTDCPLGTYMNETTYLPLSCYICDPPKTTATTKSTAETDCKLSCPVGQEYQSSTGICQACAINYFKATVGTNACQPCPYGKITYLANREYCHEPCNAGSYSLKTPTQSHAQCSACPANTYTDAINQVQCISCPGNTVTQVAAANSRDKCLTKCKANTGYCLNLGTCIDSLDLTTSVCACISTYTGTRCETRLAAEGSNLPAIIGGSIGGALGLLLLILITVCCCRYMQKPNGAKAMAKPMFPMGQMAQPGYAIPMQNTYDPSLAGYYPNTNYYPTFTAATFNNGAYSSGASAIFDANNGYPTYQ